MYLSYLLQETGFPGFLTERTPQDQAMRQAMISPSGIPDADLLH